MDDLKIFLQSLIYPQKSFKILRERKEAGKLKFSWVLPYFIMALLVSLTMYLYQPIQKPFVIQKLGEKFQSGQLPQEKYDQSIKFINYGLTFQNIISGFFIIINILIATLFLYIYLYFFNINLTFGDLFIINIFAYFPVSVGYIISFIYNALLKFSMFKTVADMKKMVLGFHIILKNDNGFLANFLAINNFFTLWYLFIVMAGISIIGRKNFNKVFTIITIPWLIFSVAMAMLNGRFN